jgi:GTP cyclohydrolase I
MQSFGNSNISGIDTDEMIGKIEQQIGGLLDTLKIDYRNDSNMQNTPKRVAKLLVNEIFNGRYAPRPTITIFPNNKKLDEIYTVGPINLRSTCSHHLLPVIGKVWIGILPNDKLIGLSKFSRLVNWIFLRPQMQEEGIIQLADELESLIEPRGLALVIKATHFCMIQRGVKESDCMMTTSVMRGLFRTNNATRMEFLELIK